MAVRGPATTAAVYQSGRDGRTPRATLERMLSSPHPFQDATLAEACRNIAPGRLEPHRLIDTAPETRLRCGLGQSLPDWLKLRYGRIDVVPDGVAYPESGEQVRELLDYAQGCAERNRATRA